MQDGWDGKCVLSKAHTYINTYIHIHTYVQDGHDSEYSLSKTHTYTRTYIHEYKHTYTYIYAGWVGQLIFALENTY